MLCTIARPDATARDAFGQPLAAPTLATRVPCYWWAGQSWVTNSADVPGQIAVDTEHVIFAPGQDVLPGDRITQVTDHLGNTVFGAEDFRVVQNPAVMRNHLDCTLRYGKAIGGRA